MREPLTILLIGPPAAGKTSVAQFLVQSMSFSTEEDAPRRLIEEDVTREQIAELREIHGEDFHVLGVDAPGDERRKRDADRQLNAGSTLQPFEEREAGWDPALMDDAEAVILNLDPSLVAAQAIAIAQWWLHRAPLTLFREMREAVEEFHRKNDFPVKTGGKETLYRHQALLTEELGEISAAITKNKGDLVEEHADLLVIVLGSAVAMGWNLEETFWRKIDKIMKREGRKVAGEMRVSAWGADEEGTLRHLLRLRSMRSILHPELPEQLELDEMAGQIELDLGLEDDR